jgi:predicted transcriptional regulator of viral defense system
MGGALSVARWKTESAHPDLAALARQQWGVVTRRQLTELGMGTRGISDWVQGGRLHRLYRGVYAVGHDRLRLEGRWLAAVFACGPGTVHSHRDAAQLWELRQGNSALIEVTVSSRNGRRGQRGIRLHRTKRLRPDEVTMRHGIPVTTVARTLLDLADVIDRQALKRAITEAEYTNQFDPTAVNAAVQNNLGRRGATLMEAATGRRHRTRSVLERRFLAFWSGIGWRSRSPLSGSRAMRSISYGRAPA